MAISELKASWLMRIAYSAGFFLSCIHYSTYIPDPQKDIEKWIGNFKGQRSLSYEYELKTASVHLKAKGDCIIGQAEHIRGIWHYAEAELEFEHIGVGDLQWTKKDSKWEESARSEESDIFVQLERLWKFGKFEYLHQEDGYLYHFKPNAPFLAPQKWKEIVGFLKISKHNFLPSSIWAGLPDSTVYWQVKLTNYNRKKELKPPITKWQRYKVTCDSLSLKELQKVLKKRLDLIGISHQTSLKDSIIILKTPHQYKTADLKEALTPGHLIVYCIADKKEQASKIGYLNGDPNHPLYLARPVLTSADIKDVKIKFDSCSKPYLLISLNKRFALSGTIAFEFDNNSIIGTTTLDSDQKLDKLTLYMHRSYPDLNMRRAMMMQTLPRLHIEAVVEGD